MTYPYVTRLYELKDESSQRPNIDRVFIANRLNTLGFEYETTFKMSETKPVSSVSAHPFASFEANRSFYYIFGDTIEDEEIKRKLCFRKS